MLRIKELGEGRADEVFDFGFAGGLSCGTALAEELDDLSVFEMEAFDLVVVAATFDGGPFDDVIGGGTKGVAHVGLLEDFFGTGTGAAIGDELVGGEVFALGAVDDVEEAELDGIGDGYAVVEIPGGGGIFEF